MAQFPILRLTRAGQEMVGLSQGGGKLIFVRAELGDGQINGSAPIPIEQLTALKHSILQVPLQSYQNKGNGEARLRFIVDNGNLTVGFFNREIGIFAKIEGGEEQLYAYTNAGNYADYIPSKETPIDSEIIDLHIVIGNAQNVTIQAPNNAYATQIDFEEHRTKNPLDHPLKSVTSGHLADDVHSLISNASLNLLKRSKTYAVGDIAYSPHLPSWARLECVKAGTTGAELPATLVQVSTGGGVLLTDGTVTWIVDDMRDGTAVGSVRGSLYLPAGYVKANGATVQRADYPRLVALVEKYGLWTDDVAVNAGLFGRGDGSGTMVLPNWTDRMVQFAGEGAGANVSAGLPNIIGRFSLDGAGISGEPKIPGQGTTALFYDPYANPSSVSFWGSTQRLWVVVKLDASVYNSIYGASDTVQPPAVNLIPVIRY